MSKKGNLFVLVGPSGSGKGTVLKEVLAAEKNTFLSVSATTRHPRPGEQHGVHYFFTSREDFEGMIRREELLEYAKYCENYYGTPKSAVLERISRGENVILEIEVQGAKKVKEMYPEAVTVFILPPSLSELRRRLTDRKTEDAETVNRRLETALGEIPYARECDYAVVNDQLPETVEEIRAIILAQSCSGRVMRDTIDRVLENC